MTTCPTMLRALLQNEHYKIASNTKINKTDSLYTTAARVALDEEEQFQK
ncbi:32911_t:CDS:2, partial [Gigaspora margarita]